MHRPGEKNRVTPGSGVCLLVGGMNPPTMDVLRALDAIHASQRFDGVWVCPLPGGADDESKRALSQIACSEWSSSSGNQAGCCTIALDKGIDSPGELLSECRRLFPAAAFNVAMLASEIRGDYEPEWAVCFHGESPRGASKAIKVPKFRPEGDVRARIAAGGDASRSVPPGVWEAVQKRRLYRGTHEVD